MAIIEKLNTTFIFIRYKSVLGGGNKTEINPIIPNLTHFVDACASCVGII